MIAVKYNVGLNEVALLTLDDEVVSIRVGEAKLRTACKDVREAEELFNEVSNDLFLNCLFTYMRGEDDKVPSCYMVGNEVLGVDPLTGVEVNSFEAFIEHSAKEGYASY